MKSSTILDFEKKLFELKEKLRDLESDPENDNPKLIKKLRQEIAKEEKSSYKNLTSWQKTLIARHPDRPGTYEFIEQCVTDFIELKGDRTFADDAALIGGLGKIDTHPFMIIGQVKGKNTTENVKRNFGMPHPEGFRKSLRLMEMANHFNLPILSLIDTPGAYPGTGAEERQQSRAIAISLQKMGEFKVPIIAVVLGEGGSGGALALAVANRLLMMEHAIFGVISPEGCASILWNDYKKVKQAAAILKQTATDLKNLFVIEEMIAEPTTCAHNEPQEALARVKEAVIRHYLILKKLSMQSIINQRKRKFRMIGVYKE